MSESKSGQKCLAIRGHGLHVLLPIALAVVAASSGGCAWKYTEVASGSDILASARPALSNDGTVVAVAPTRLLVSNGATSSAIDLALLGLQVPVPGLVAHRLAQLRDQGDLVFVATRPAAVACAGSNARGAYRIAASGGTLTTLFEGCQSGSVGNVGNDIAMSPNGTVAFSQITNGQGALYRGPAAGPVSVLHSGTGMLYNTGSLDVDDAGRVVVQMEYGDQGLQRAILAFDTPEQAMDTLNTAIEKLNVGTQPSAAINTTGTVAFALPNDVTIQIAQVPYTFVAGVYTATPTLLNTPKSLTLVADKSGPYCGFGNVDINDSGTVAFEARLTSSGGCASANLDGIFTGPDSSANAVVVRGNAGLGAHQSFDNIVLGEISNSGDVSFLTTTSQPSVDPVKVWRAHH